MKKGILRIAVVALLGSLAIMAVYVMVRGIWSSLPFISCLCLLGQVTFFVLFLSLSVTFVLFLLSVILHLFHPAGWKMLDFEQVCEDSISIWVLPISAVAAFIAVVIYDPEGRAAFWARTAVPSIVVVLIGSYMLVRLGVIPLVRWLIEGFRNARKDETRELKDQ